VDFSYSPKDNGEKEKDGVGMVRVGHIKKTKSSLDLFKLSISRMKSLNETMSSFLARSSSLRLPNPLPNPFSTPLSYRPPNSLPSKQETVEKVEKNEEKKKK
jgi:hypothetical protein